MAQPRRDYIVWEDYFMGLAVLSAKRSKDPNTQVGACIVNENNRVVSLGYNGMPDRCSDSDFPWGRNEAEVLEDKYLYVCFAEMNAIVNKNTANLNNCTMYTTLFPHCESAKIIVQSGIRTVVYLNSRVGTPYTASETIFDAAGVRLVRFHPTVQEIVLDLNVGANQIV